MGVACSVGGEGTRGCGMLCDDEDEMMIGLVTSGVVDGDDEAMG